MVMVVMEVSLGIDLCEPDTMTHVSASILTVVVINRIHLWVTERPWSTMEGDDQ
jgi:hypothetical protein